MWVSNGLHRMPPLSPVLRPRTLWSVALGSCLVAIALAAPVLGAESGPLARRALLAGGLGLGLLMVPVRGARSLPGPLVLLVAWACLRWALGGVTDPGLAAGRVADLAVLAAAFALARGRRATAAGLVVGITALLATTGLWGLLPAGLVPWPQVDPGGGLLGSRNLTAAAVAVGVPLALALGRRPAHGATTLLAAAYLLASGNRLGVLALAAGVLLVLGPRTLAHARASRPGLALAGAAALALVLAAAAALPGLGSTTVVERLHLSRATLTLVADAPLLGHGPGQWAVHHPAAAAGDPDLVHRDRFAPLLAGAPEVGGITLTGSRLPAHAHQDPLELLAELGPLGLLLLAVALGRGLMGLAAADPVRRGGAAGLAVLVLVSLAHFPLAQPEVLALAGLLLALAEDPTRAPRRDRSEPTPRLAPRLAAPALLALAILPALELGASTALTAAREASATGDHATAAAHLDEATRRAPWHLATRRQGAWLESVRRRPAAALVHAEAAARLRPHHPAVLNDLALCLAALDDPRRLGEALAHLERARTLAPADDAIALNLGQAYLTAGRPADAEPLLAQAVDQNPNLTTAWQGLADAALARGDLHRALRANEAARASRLRNRIAHR